MVISSKQYLRMIETADLHRLAVFFYTYLRSHIFLSRLFAQTKQLRPALYLPVAATTFNRVRQISLYGTIRITATDGCASYVRMERGEHQCDGSDAGGAGNRWEILFSHEAAINECFYPVHRISHCL